MNDFENTQVQHIYMPSRMTWETYKDKRILIHNYADLPTDKAIEMLIENSTATASLGRDNLLLLVDVTGMFASKKLVSMWKERAKKNAHLYKKIAVVGVTGLLNTFLRTINKVSGLGARPFEDAQQAKDWLVSDD